VTVAILSRGQVVKWPFHEWLADAVDDLHLFTAPRPEPASAELDAALERYAAVHHYEHMARNALPELDIVALAERSRLRGLVCLVEWDLERAGALRDRLGLPGQTHASAVAYRNKVRMKDVLRAHGLPVAAHRRVEGVLDVLDHVREHGYPVVVKPVAASGSTGVEVIESRAQLEALADRGLASRVEATPDLMVESFVAGREYVVDGLVVDGRLAYSWPSSYLGTPTAYDGAGGYLAAVMLDAGHPLRPRLQELAARAVRALPSPGCFAFHAEVFHTLDDRLVIGEIGSRTGGGRIDEMCRRVFGVSPNRAMARHQAGLDPEVPALHDVERVREVGVGGWILFWGRAGTARRVAPAPAEPWVLDWQLGAAAGDVVKPAAHSGDGFASAVVVGPTFADVEERTHALADWFWRHTEIVPNGQLAPA
jgi:hypothetical protein